MKPRVSICIPAYMHTEYLRKTLRSILMQSYKDYEVIITDDSPDDSVRDLCQEFNFGTNLIYHKNPRRLGSPENWNESMRRASGKYIKIMHHDDWFANSQSLKRFVEMLDHNNTTDFAFSSAVAVFSEKVSSIYAPTEKKIKSIQKKPEDLLFNNIIGSPSATIWRKNISLYFDKKLIWLVDIDFYIRLLQKNPKIIFCSTPLVNVNSNNNRISSSCENNKKINLFEYFYLFNKLHKSKFLINRKEFIFFLKLFIRFNVNSIQEIRNSGYKGKIYKIFYLILFLKKIYTNVIFKKEPASVAKI